MLRHSLETADEILLPQIVSTAHQNDVRAGLSIGGWTGSQWFSTNVGTAKNRTTFVKTVTDVAQKYNLDGLDFDWEYPGAQGIGCNTINPNDILPIFLRELRNSTIGNGKAMALYFQRRQVSQLGLVLLVLLRKTSRSSAKFWTILRS